ncbi:hypothetical protein [Photobacterium damselae]|uniref:hypothetical protein n=1 Tax=Photobacterium damselae TaxID=38293 RepID=UPI001F2C0459|nr:hypothetical protein [Photobacterium damselae]UKA02546.1 hypothetical protein IHC89_04285 [Photobacterium damselae subsp. damselae]
MKYSILEKILIALSTFVSHIIFARLLSTNEYGEFLYHQALFFILIQTVAFGIKNNYFMLKKFNRRNEEIISTVWILRLIIFIVTIGIIIIIFRDVKVTIVYLISIFFILDIFEWDKEFDNEFQLIFKVRFFVLFFLLIIKFILILFFDNYYIALCLWLIELPICYIVIGFLEKRKYL